VVNYDLPWNPNRLSSGSAAFAFFRRETSAPCPSPADPASPEMGSFG
jgi:hypothetical protein